jgi:transcriptional regulator with XRE-family HTH domain
LLRWRNDQRAPGSEKAFGQALREIRESKKISQERLALESGFDRTYISLIERDINSPTIRILAKLVGIAAKCRRRKSFTAWNS